MATKNEELNEVCELVRKTEDEYTRGGVTISEHVVFDIYETINTIEAYLNSKHTSGETDSLGREKPFFNIVVSAANIWQRATDIDRKNIKIKATKSKDIIDAFLANIHVQAWMTKIKFGQFLNEWGRVLARYGSAVTKWIEKDGQLVPSVIAWNRLICDPIDFENNPKIEVLELTEAQLRMNKSYDKDVVNSLCDAKVARETIDRRRKDNKSDYIKLYEVHGNLPLSYLTGKEEDKDEYVQQMHVVSFVASRERGKYDNFTLYSGREKKDPYKISHLIKEDGRTLAIGAVEHLFQSQWMANHTAKAIKDQLDLSSKLFFQTPDVNFTGQNAISNIENGDIMIHAINMPLTQVNNGSHDITSLQNFNTMWKSLGNEITGVSEAMLGVAPKSGTAWRQTEALLQESYSLFELMTENKGLEIEDMFREYILPFIKKNMDTGEEISATLEQYDIDWLDSKYIKNRAIIESKKVIKSKVLAGEAVSLEDQSSLIQDAENGLQESLKDLGNTRFFKPSDIDGKTWKEQFKNLEWDVEVDVTGENKDYQSALATFNTALQVVMNPAYSQNKEAQLIVSKILNATGQISPIELSALRSNMNNPAPVALGGSVSGAQPTQPININPQQ